MLQIERIPVIVRGDLVIDPQFHTVKVAGKEVHLYPKEYEVLYFLSQHPGWVLSSKQIYRAVWNEEEGSYDTVSLWKKADWIIWKKKWNFMMVARLQSGNILRSQLIFVWQIWVIMDSR